MSNVVGGVGQRATPRRALWVLRLSIVEVAVTVAAAALVTIGGSSDAVSCPSFPACLTDQATWVAAVHQAVAGGLLVLAVAIVFLAIPLRGTKPPVLFPALLGLLALIATATMGMLLAAGTVPLSDAPIQFVFLAVVVLLFAWTGWDAFEVRRAPAPSSEGPRSPAPRAGS